MARTTDKSRVLKALRENGNRLGNGALRKILGWSEEKYWKIHAEMIEAGLIATGRGQGGSVILVVPESEEEARQSASVLPRSEIASVSEELVASISTVLEPETRELDLYEPALAALHKWAKTKGLADGVYKITAQQGRRPTGGSWSRPDLVAVFPRKFAYLPDRVLEIYSFEVKSEEPSIKGVLEALAHRESSTRSYVLYYVGAKPWDRFAEAKRIEQIAARHGVGVIVASDIEDLDCWDERIEPTRSVADPEALEQFIGSTFDGGEKDQIRKFF